MRLWQRTSGRVSLLTLARGEHIVCRSGALDRRPDTSMRASPACSLVPRASRCVGLESAFSPATISLVTTNGDNRAVSRPPLFVLYVRNQEAAARFYRDVLSTEPRLHVPGMTEIELPGGGVLGLMPSVGIHELLPALQADDGLDTPRCELYLTVDDPASLHARALAVGATELSALARRDWGDDVAYSRDLDGHVLAFARRGH